MRNAVRTISRTVLIIITMVMFTGCYHARIQTGLEPSAKVVEKPWASGWIYGLVGPPELDVSDECTSGVAEVETQLSFINMLVSAITFSIYTPMTLEVTCTADGAMSSAAPERVIQLSRISTDAAKQEALEQAATIAATTGESVFIHSY